jgi:hypothetical protein
MPRIDGARIVVIEINGFAVGDAAFVDAVRVRARERPELCRVETLDLSAHFAPDHFLPIDGHLSEAGHELVAEMLLQVLKDRQPAG